LHYEGDSIGISGGVSYNNADAQDSKYYNPDSSGANKSVGYGSEGESQTSITKSAINTSNIKVTDQKAQKATGTSTEEIIAQVHTDTTTGTLETDSGALVNNFDAAEVQKELDVQTRVTQTFDTTRQEVKSYLNTKIDNANEIIEDKSGKYTKEQIAEAYKTVEDMQQLGVLVDSISGALYTPADDALGTVANTLSPAIVYEIGQYFKENEFLNTFDNGDRAEEGSAAHILAHTIVAGLVAGAAGNDALSAAISAGGSEALAPMLSKLLYDTDDTNKLDADQKETVSAILSLGSSVLTSATGGSNTDIAASGIASSVAVENNRALLQAERTWLEDEKNIEAFAEYYKEKNGIELSLEEAALILARGGASLVDKSYYDALGVDDNFDYDDARDFIQQNYTDASTLEYNDPNSPTGTYLTHGFSPDSYEYENRYANLQGFYENKDFYTQYLNLSDSSNDASILDYGEGAFNPFTQLAYTFEKDPFGTIGAVGEGLLDFAMNPIDGLQDVGMEIAELKAKGDLDTLLNDDVSAAQHYGEAVSITASVLMPGAVEGKQALKKGLNNAVDGIAPDISRVTGDGSVGEVLDELSQLPYQTSRPPYETGQVEAVWNNAIERDGKVYDPTRQEIIWDTSIPRNGQWDMGHLPEEQYRDVHFDYTTGGMTKEEFLKWYRNPNNYRPELPSTNRGRQYESK